MDGSESVRLSKQGEGGQDRLRLGARGARDGGTGEMESGSERREGTNDMVEI